MNSTQQPRHDYLFAPSQGEFTISITNHSIINEDYLSKPMTLRTRGLIPHALTNISFQLSFIPHVKPRPIPFLPTSVQSSSNLTVREA